MKLEKLSYKTLFTIFFLAVAGIIFFLKIGGKTTKVSATWWNNSWNYRRSISVTNSSGVGQTNVLVKVLENYDLSSLITAGKIQSNLDDLRFTDSGTTPISYYISDTTIASADVWAIIPSLPSGGTTVWMYYGNASATSASTPFYSYTGTKQFIDDTGGKFRIKFLSSGTLVSNVNLTIDAFLVGGGGGGSKALYNVNTGGGGGGGYTATHTNVSAQDETNYDIIVGSGGIGTTTSDTAGGIGGTSSAFGYTVSGGNSVAGKIGGDGGSGGGGGGSQSVGVTGGFGGTNGGNGLSSGGIGGTGQGTTTREFGEVGGDLYAGGGGGASYSTTAVGAGGAGGGGNGGNENGDGIAGTTNTGGGGGGGGYLTSSGAGGSGVVIIRYASNGSITVNSSEEFSPILENPWWNNSWNYRRSISVTNSSGVGQTNVLVKVLENYDLSSLITAGKIQSNLDDLRFTDSGTTPISYYISDTTIASADVWAIIPSLPSGGTTVWMYYGNASATSASTPFYSYTGTKQFIDDTGGKFRIKFLSSGTLVSNVNLTIDAFLVGGGGGSNYGGAGGGYTTTQLNTSINNSSAYPIVVGLGGSGCTTTWTTPGHQGQSSSAFSLTAAGGYGSAASTMAGADGGSGGGSMNGYDGASNGNSATVGGNGQGTTTREFGEPTGDLYAGGGGGGENNDTIDGGIGGAGGGGNGGRRYSYPPTNGTPNTGGGGGGGNATYVGANGGSGIVVIRHTSIGSITVNSDEQIYSSVKKPWINSLWRYRQSITITNSCGTTQTSVLIKVLNNFDATTLINNNKLQSDLDDLRFVDSNGNSLNYWISDNTTSSVDAWAIFPSFPSNGTTIYMYYGNPTATSNSSPPYIYNGSSQALDDGHTKTKFLTSDTFTPLANMSIDAFLVGGGGGGDTYAGGGGGYTTTSLSISISTGTTYPISIGIGGSRAVSGESTSAFSSTAAGGIRGNGSSGGSGGCGGGAWGGGSDTCASTGGKGGSDGGDGGDGPCGGTGGTGQGTTTREFNEGSGEAYAGGGGGGGWHLNFSGGVGGTTGGGHGAETQTAGTANTGGGGGGGNNYAGIGASGGSGIVIIRYHSLCGLAGNPNNEEDYNNPTPATACVINESQNDTYLVPKWQDNTIFEEGYYIQKSTDNGSWTEISNSNPNTTYYTDTNISSNHTYQYRIAPYTSTVTSYNWCYTPVLNLGQENFNLEGLNLEGINLN